MEIKNVSIIRLDEITNATTKPLDRSKKTIWICFAVILVCSIIMIASGDLVLGLVFLAIGIFFPIFNWAMRRAVVKKMQSVNQLISGGIYCEYVFRDNDFTVSTVAGEHRSINQVSYENLFKMQIVEDMLFLYINTTNAYVVKSAGFNVPQEYDKLIQFFKESYPTKFMQTK